MTWWSGNDMMLSRVLEPSGFKEDLILAPLFAASKTSLGTASFWPEHVLKRTREEI